jgi:phosphoribosylamine--glycine ligase
MRILIIDEKGYMLDWALRCKDAGHEVKHFIRDHPHSKDIGIGLIDIVRDFSDWLKWADLIVAADNVKYVRELDAYRNENPDCCCLSCNAEGAELELDRLAGMKVMRDAGIVVPMYKEFTDYDKAISYVKTEDRRFVSKPNGDADKSLSYVSKTPADMVYMLERWKKSGKLKDSFILQDYIEGTEMAVGGWFSHGEWNEGWCENYEHKKFMNDDLGTSTGEQGTIVQHVRKSKLADEFLRPLTKHLTKIDYVGYIDVNCIIDEDGEAWPLELTCRFGWPTFQIQCELMNGDDPAEWMVDLCHGSDNRTFQTDRVGCGVVVSIPDYPYSHVTKKEVVGVPIYGVRLKPQSGVHLCEVMLGEAPVETRDTIAMMPHIVTAGDYLLVMVGTGTTISSAQKQAYRLLQKLIIPNSPMWRTDIGDRLRKQLPSIQKWGYASSLRF